MNVSREQRLDAVSSSMPAVLWWVVIVGAIVSIVFIWMLHMDLRPAALPRGDHGALPRRDDLPDLCHGPPLAGRGEHRPRALSIGLRPRDEVGRAVVKNFRSLVLALAVLVAGPASADEKFHAFASVGTGAMNGVYFPVGGAICAIVNDHLRATGVRCSARDDAWFGLQPRCLRSGELEFAIVQSDVAFDAYKGKGGSSEKPFQELRSVLALHPELVTIVGRAGIHEISDLAGKRIYAGPEGSGSRRTWETLQQALGWTRRPGAADCRHAGRGHRGRHLRRLDRRRPARGGTPVAQSQRPHGPLRPQSRGRRRAARRFAGRRRALPEKGANSGRPHTG